MRTALDFYEDDENPREVAAAFEAAEKRVTARPSVTTSGTTLQGYVEWQEV